MTNLDINKQTLAMLSVQAAGLWDTLDAAEPEQVEMIVESLFGVQEGIAKKVDATVYVREQLKLDIESLESRLKMLVDLHKAIIDKRKKTAEQLDAKLIDLHEKGILADRVAGEEREITFQLNPPKVEELLIEPSSPDFPQQYVETRVEYSVLKKQILADHKAGKDISGVAKVSRGTSVRFKTLRKGK